MEHRHPSQRVRLHMSRWRESLLRIAIILHPTLSLLQFLLFAAHITGYKVAYDFPDYLENHPLASDPDGRLNSSAASKLNDYFKGQETLSTRENQTQVTTYQGLELAFRVCGLIFCMLSFLGFVFLWVGRWQSYYIFATENKKKYGGMVVGLLYFSAPVLTSAGLCFFNAGVNIWLQDPNIIHHLEYLDTNFPGRIDLDPRDRVIGPWRIFIYSFIALSIISGLIGILDFLMTHAIVTPWRTSVLSSQGEKYSFRDGKGTTDAATGLLADLYRTLKESDVGKTIPAEVPLIPATGSQRNRDDSVIKISVVMSTTLPVELKSNDNPECSTAVEAARVTKVLAVWLHSRHSTACLVDHILPSTYPRWGRGWTGWPQWVSRVSDSSNLLLST